MAESISYEVIADVRVEVVDGKFYSRLILPGKDVELSGPWGTLTAMMQRVADRLAEARRTP